MSYLLDTNIIVHFFRDKHNIKSIFSEYQNGQLFISEITLAELKYGAELSSRKTKNEALIKSLLLKVELLTISDSIPEFAKQKARLRTLGTPIADFDLLIGCTAIKNNLIMVTQNTKHFKRIEGIKLEDWTEKGNIEQSEYNG